MHFITKVALILCFTHVLSDNFQNKHTLRLNNGVLIPIIGFGTSSIAEDAVRTALLDGYRHIDTSLQYRGSKPGEESEVIIGKVIKELIKEGKVKRQDLFIVSKLESEYHHRKRVTEGIKESLKRLQLDYLDLYLVHSPDSKPVGVDIVETWQGMEDVLKANLTRSIGVSNFNEEQINRIIANGSVVPVTNQVKCNPYENQKKLLSYLTQHNITLTAYSPLGGKKGNTVLKDKILAAIGHKHNVSAAQVALKYQIQRGVIVIPMSLNPKYIKENIDLFSFALSSDDIKQIDSLNVN